MFTVADLLQRARTAAGLDKFGEDTFIEGLERLVASVTTEGRLNETGEAAIEAQIVDMLVRRLQVEDWYRRHPEIDEQEIIAPLIGLGLPRTGSTALHVMLGEDPAARAIRNWESQAPCPPPTTETQHTDPRIALAEQTLERRDKLFPRAKAMVPSSARTATECQTFMGYDFKSQLFQAFARMPSYTEWLEHKADLVPTYRYVKRVLKLLQWRCPPTRWRLKNPSHSLFIDALNTVFPDARFWMTHRDVASVIPSVADLYLELTSAFSDDIDKLYLGRLTSGFCELGMRRMIAFRNAGNDHRFFDVQFADFQADPFPVIARLYDFLGEEFTPAARAAMEAWRRDMPREQGIARTDPAAFGFDIPKLRERFRFYSDRFDVPPSGG